MIPKMPKVFKQGEFSKQDESLTVLCILKQNDKLSERRAKRSMRE